MAGDRGDLKYFIEELKSRVDIVATLGAHVKLSRSGRNFLGLCPFHSEDTPSFSVNPERKYYHCFGCGAHGDVIKFLQQLRHGGDFMATLRVLAAEHGMELPSRGGGAAERHQAQHRLLEKVREYYTRCLRQDEQALAYLHGRGFKDKTLEEFELGYAPDSWHGMEKLAKNEGEKRMMLGLGLLKRHETKGNIYNAFRGRVMFPIRNERGKMVGFGGRTLVGDSAKYLNSPQSPVFDKGRLLYGLHRAIPAVKEEGTALLVEGYTDVMALAAAGLAHAVAPMGTALTGRQVEVVLRYADKIVFCFDGDEAGRRAAERALETLLGSLKDGKGASFLFLPSGEDPDSFVRENGREAFLEQATSAASLGDFLVETVGKDFSASSDEVRTVEFLSDVSRYIEKIDGEKAPFLKETLYEALAQKSGISSQRLQAAAGKAIKAKAKESLRYGVDSAPVLGKDGIFYRLLNCLNSCPELAERVSELPILGEPREVALFQEVYLWLLEQERPEPNVLAQHLAEIGQARLARQLMDSARNHPSGVDVEQIFEEMANKLRGIASKKEQTRKIRDSLKEIDTTS